MNEFLKEALKKLEEGCKSGKFDWKADAMKDAIEEQLADFCRQNGEIAQAVAQGGSFADCMAAVAKGVGNSISDLEAYRRAVQFYFPGAEVRMQMTIDLIGAAGEDKPSSTDGGIILDFRDFL